MRKQQELTDPNSCLNKANDTELLFMLLGRDAAAPAAIRAWVDARLTLGKNKPEDIQIVEALATAKSIESDLKLAHHAISAKIQIHITGRPGSGKTALAIWLTSILANRGDMVTLIDGEISEQHYFGPRHIHPLAWSRPARITMTTEVL